MTILQKEQGQMADSPKPLSFIETVNQEVAKSPSRIKFGPHAFTQAVENGLITFTPTRPTIDLIQEMGKQKYQETVQKAAKEMEWGEIKRIEPDGSIHFSFRLTPVRKR